MHEYVFQENIKDIIMLHTIFPSGLTKDSISYNLNRDIAVTIFAKIHANIKLINQKHITAEL